jgi:hypothetical protein
VAKLAELALTTYTGNGRAVPPDVAYVLAAIALGAPATAARCPHLLAVLATDVRATVFGLASAPRATGSGTGWPVLADSLTAGEAAQRLGITADAVRKRCRRGQLAATKHLTDAWRIDPASIEPNGAQHDPEP